MNDKMLKKHINECLKRICTIKGFMSDKDTDKYGCEENISILKSAIEACKKQIPTKVKTKKCDDCGKEDCGDCEDYYDRCPSCNEGLGRDSGEIFKFCPDCGQALDWEN